MILTKKEIKNSTIQNPAPRQHLKVTAIALHNRLKEAENLFDSITCLCVEGVEFHKRHDIIMAVSKEAVKGYLLCKGGKDGD